MASASANIASRERECIAQLNSETPIGFTSRNRSDQQHVKSGTVTIAPGASVVLYLTDSYETPRLRQHTIWKRRVRRRRLL